MFKSSKRLKKGVNFGKGGFDGFSTHFSEGDQYIYMNVDYMDAVHSNACVCDMQIHITF